MVAEWSRAETGVGPSMASGSQTCSGNWALLPMTPQKISRAEVVSEPGRHGLGHRGGVHRGDIQAAVDTG